MKLDNTSEAQVLVYHDLLGMMQHPHHAKVTPKFCKQYAAVGHVRPLDPFYCNTLKQTTYLELLKVHISVIAVEERSKPEDWLCVDSSCAGSA